MATDRNELLWEQAIDDAGHTGDYTQADLIALNARLERDQAEAQEVANDKNDYAILEITRIGSLVPTSAEEYLLIKGRLSAITGDETLRDDVKRMSEDVRLEFIKEFPELDSEARKIQLDTTQELILVAGLGKAATRTN